MISHHIFFIRRGIRITSIAVLSLAFLLQAFYLFINNNNTSVFVPTAASIFSSETVEDHQEMDPSFSLLTDEDKNESNNNNTSNTYDNIENFNESTGNNNSATLFTSRGGEPIPGQYIIVLKKNISDNIISSTEAIENLSVIANKGGAEVIYRLNSTGMLIIRITSNHIDNLTSTNNQKAENILDIIRSNRNVESILQDRTVVPYDQSVSLGLRRIDEDLFTSDGHVSTATINYDNIAIAIIDNGVVDNHPDLNVYKRIHFIGNSDDPNCGSGTFHGTHVAGIAAAKNNNIGIVGVAPGAKIWSVKVLEYNSTDDECEGSDAVVIAGIDYVISHAKEIDVVNLSLGHQCTEQPCDLVNGEEAAMQIAIHKAVMAGVTFVVAAGNDASNVKDFMPAASPDVITVSAIADSDGKCGGLGPMIGTRDSNGSRVNVADDTLAPFSNWGQGVTIAAPGVNILSTIPGGGYGYGSGTSMAAPFVAGAAALYKSLHPNATPLEIRNALESRGSSFQTQCNGNAHGYFTDGENIHNITHEPLLFIPLDSQVVLAHQVDNNQSLAMLVDNNGALAVSWVTGYGTWHVPMEISSPNFAPMGCHLALAHQVDNNQLDVMLVDNNGALAVSWVTGYGTWHVPMEISNSYFATAGANVALAHQVDSMQLDVLAVNSKRALAVSWVTGYGTWHVPMEISSPNFAPS